MCYSKKIPTLRTEGWGTPTLLFSARTMCYSKKIPTLKTEGWGTPTLLFSARTGG
jgi:hypothetical protein